MNLDEIIRPVTSENTQQVIETLTRTYPFVRSERLTQTAFGRPISTLVIGTGPRKVLYTAAHHANEWITTLILLKFARDFARAIDEGTQIGGIDARELSQRVTIYMVPLVDPDGVDLVTGAIAPDSPEYCFARALAQNYPQIPFPNGWKANLLGVDLNLQYPAG